MDQHNEAEKVEATAQTHSGPLPSPDVFKAYEDAIPGMGQRLLQLVEIETAYRHKREAEEQRLRRYALFAGLGVTLSFLAAAVWLVVAGHPTAGITLGTIDIVGLVSISAWGRRQEADAREDRAVQERAPHEHIEESEPAPEGLGVLGVQLVAQRQALLAGVVSLTAEKEAP